jgi:hypothetical protein
MNKVILFLATSLLAMGAMGKNHAAGKKTGAEASRTVASPTVTTTRTTTTTSVSFDPKELFESDNKSELFLSVTQAQINTGSGASDLEIAGMYTYLIKPQIQVGAQIAFGSKSYKGGGSSNHSDIYALGIYNFVPEIHEAAFAFGGLGFGSYAAGGASESKVGVKVGGGKRFPLMDKVQYVPMAWIQKMGEFDPALYLMPVNFSLIF